MLSNSASNVHFSPDTCHSLVFSHTTSFNSPNNPIRKKESVATQLCPTLCNPVNCSPPGSSVHRILQARILEWVTISFSRGSSRPRDQTRVSRTGGRRFKIYLIVHDMIHNAYLEQLVSGNWSTGVLNNPLVLLVSSLMLANYSSRQTEQVGGGG